MASVGNNTCVDEAVQWYTNSVGETPCTTYQRVRQLCNPGFLTPSMRDLTPPDSCNDQLSTCCCNSITFALSMLCMNCQYGRGAGSDIGIDAGNGAYEDYLNGCSPVTNQSLAESVQTGVCTQNIKLPNFLYTLFWNTGAWFYVYTESTATLNMNDGTNVTTLCPSSSSSSSSPPGTTTTASSSTTTTSPSSSPPINPAIRTSHSSAGAVAGGVVGGIVALAVLAALIFFFCCRRNRRQGGAVPYKDGPRRKEGIVDLDGDAAYQVAPFMGDHSPQLGSSPLSFQGGDGSGVGSGAGYFAAGAGAGAAAAGAASHSSGHRNGHASPSTTTYPSASASGSRSGGGSHNPGASTDYITQTGTRPSHGASTSFDSSNPGLPYAGIGAAGAGTGEAAAPGAGGRRDPVAGMSEKQRLAYLTRQRSYAEPSSTSLAHQLSHSSSNVNNASSERSTAAWPSPDPNAAQILPPGAGLGGAGDPGDEAWRHVDAGISLDGADLARSRSGRLPPPYMDYSRGAPTLDTTSEGGGGDEEEAPRGETQDFGKR